MPMLLRAPRPDPWRARAESGQPQLQPSSLESGAAVWPRLDGRQLILTCLLQMVGKFDDQYSVLRNQPTNVISPIWL